MPVHPSEEEAPSGIYEKVAKDPSSATKSTASDHEHHDNEHTPGKASAQNMQSKGPQIPMNMSGVFHLIGPDFQKTFRLMGYFPLADMPPKASKEELKKRSDELNQ